MSELEKAQAHILYEDGVTDLSYYASSVNIGPHRTIELMQIPGRTDCAGNPIERVWPPEPKGEE